MESLGLGLGIGNVPAAASLPVPLAPPALATPPLVSGDGSELSTLSSDASDTWTYDGSMATVTAREYRLVLDGSLAGGPQSAAELTVPGDSGGQAYSYEIRVTIAEGGGGRSSWTPIRTGTVQDALVLNQTADGEIMIDYASGQITITVHSPMMYAGSYTMDAADLDAGPVNLVPPRIEHLADADGNGSIDAGDTVGIGDPASDTSYPGLWVYDPDVGGIGSAFYQWQADTGGDGNFANLSGATSSVSALTSGEAGDDVRVQEMLADNGGSRAVSSAAISVTGVPAALVDSDWSVATGSGAGELDVTIASLPSDGGATITDIEYELDASGTWVSSGGTTSFTITGLTAATSYDVRLRAVNSVGAGAAGNTESATTGAESGFTETSVTSVNTSTYLTAGSTVADAPGILFFASVENVLDNRGHLIGIGGKNTGFMYDYGGGDSLVTPRLMLYGADDGALAGMNSDTNYAETERLHILGVMYLDGSEFFSRLAVWSASNDQKIDDGWNVQAGSNANGNTSFELAGELGDVTWTVFGRGDTPTNQGFDGICYRLAAWTFPNIADVPDITSAAVRDWFASGGSLVDPATSRGNITGTPLIDLSGSVADWNAGTHDGSLTLTSTGNFT